MAVALSPTARTTVVRGKKRSVIEREALYDVLTTAPICHLGVVAGARSGDPRGYHPIVLPTAFGFDLDGPDEGGSLYLHGSVAARSLVDAGQSTVCVTFTVLDGLVLARSGFHHSMNYRSAVVIGEARVVGDAAERAKALDLIVDHVVPGRSATLRPPTAKELAATVVIAVPLHEASVKIRAGDAVDEPEDVAAGVWAGVIPMRLVADGIVRNGDAVGDPPPDVVARATVD